MRSSTIDSLISSFIGRQNPSEEVLARIDTCGTSEVSGLPRQRDSEYVERTGGAEWLPTKEAVPERGALDTHSLV
jgi:hypothetical protein